MRILAMMAKRNQRKLDAYDAAGRPTAASLERRRDLGRWAAEARARLAAARERRYQRSGL